MVHAAETSGRTKTTMRLAAPAALIAATIALLASAGRGEASVTSACSEPEPQGRLVCIVVEDLDDVSPSGVTGSGKQQVDVQAYGFYKVTIKNNGGNALTNGTATLTLTDTVEGGGTLASTAELVPGASASFCSATSTDPNVITCPLPNLAAGATTGPFVVTVRTSKTANVVSTTATVATSFKEGAKQGANPATFSVSETTSLEPQPQLSLAWSPPGQEVRLGTSPADLQFSTLKFRVPTGKGAFLASLGESSGSICPPKVTCQTELVTTDLSGGESQGVFSPQNPFVLTLTVSLDLLKKPAIDVVYHLKDNGDLEAIRTQCSAAAPGVPDVLPCFTSSKDLKLKLLIVEIQAWENGRWQG